MAYHKLQGELHPKPKLSTFCALYSFEKCYRHSEAKLNICEKLKNGIKSFCGPSGSQVIDQSSIFHVLLTQKLPTENLLPFLSFLGQFASAYLYYY